MNKQGSATRQGTPRTRQGRSIPAQAGPPRTPATTAAWSEDELAGVRAELEEQARELRREIAAAESSWTALQLDGSGEGAGDDQADAGSKTFEREHELSLANNSRHLLAQVRRALDRIEAGTYGICESCGRSVGKARLQAFPRATLCVACKSREERR